MHFLSSAILLLAVFGPLASGHSWVVCSKYQGTNLDTSFDKSKCFGWPRNAEYYMVDTFGLDRGYNSLLGSTGKVCATPKTYTANYPKATWKRGEELCINWPAKNHVASNQVNPWIPDHGVELRALVSTQNEPTSIEGFNIPVIDFGSSPSGPSDPLVAQNHFPRPGFQNCPSFNSNDHERTYCSQCFTVPNNLPVGELTIAWIWKFNSVNPGDTYTTCFDVDVI